MTALAATLAEPTLAEQISAQVKQSGTSFYLAMRILAPERRDAMYAIYAFCREVDDIADDGATQEERIAGLDQWRREIAALYAGHPTHLVARALVEPVARFQLRQADFLAIIDGMQMDAVADIVAPSEAELDLYCARVASAVGLLSVRAFGCISADADQVAEALGRALQLTNILRDIDEDAARGRLYLPRELLELHGIPYDDIAAVLHHPALPEVCNILAARADAYYHAAMASMKRCPRRTMRAAAVMATTYQAVLTRLRRRGWRDLATPVKVPKAMKIWLALRHGLV